MRNVTSSLILAATMILPTSAFAQSVGGGNGGTNGTISGGTTSYGSVGSPVGGYGTTPSTTTGIGNGNNPGIGNQSDPAVRITPGINANGPCNGARSTSGNNTPAC